MGRKAYYERDSQYCRNRVRKIKAQCPDISQRAIAKMLGISATIVGKYLKEHHKFKTLL